MGKLNTVKVYFPDKKSKPLFKYDPVIEKPPSMFNIYLSIILMYGSLSTIIYFMDDIPF